MTSSFVPSNPLMGRVARWQRRGRNHMSLWEGNGGFGCKLFATVERGRDGRWRAAYGIEPSTAYPDAESAVAAVSRRVFDEYDLEIRTPTRVIIARPGGIRIEAPRDGEPSSADDPQAARSM